VKGAVRKSFEYRSRLKWLGERRGAMDFGEGKPELPIAAGPEFKGHSGIITPEDMLLGAISACTMTSFVALAERHSLDFSSYEDEAWGLVSHDGEVYRFTEGNVHIVLVIGREEDRSKAEELIEKAHRYCFISNSVRFPVEVTADIRVEEKTEAS